ncbi:uncharacterized protein LOC127853477 isoform X1 [Dreissena polymorpha]|uniref:NACHT domain-containing protein n=1 Tax=Dreissena polymorpha TaxID=45954 RepID=A0A9D4HL45_DREPO|nr:uncharacterized protein LOC127853477 isoform X1 [Dreissena polymorpha]XP_052243987.1 uncharacterized protein LOC127853477 isoform X1 [Dreissena polymorpha]XP_052243988.1 uncharacterized protein LOC127853477 isoform X1 [Dreissena polymorpha]KAH3723459.1 hypothetical protein DPMN_049247 [Dreissena polymorpha]
MGTTSSKPARGARGIPYSSSGQGAKRTKASSSSQGAKQTTLSSSNPGAKATTSSSSGQGAKSTSSASSIQGAKATTSAFSSQGAIGTKASSSDREAVETTYSSSYHGLSGATPSSSDSGAKIFTASNSDGKARGTPQLQDTEMAHIEIDGRVAIVTRDAVDELRAQGHAIMNNLELFEINSKRSIDSGAIDSLNELSLGALNIMRDIESVGIGEKDAIVSGAEDGKRELEATCIKLKEDIERERIKVMYNIYSGVQGLHEREHEKARDVIQSWLIEQYRAMCVLPVSMLDPGIDVPFERIYVSPSITELRRVQETDNILRGETDCLSCYKDLLLKRIYVSPSITELRRGQETDNILRGETDCLSCYKDLLHRDGNHVNTIYIQGDPGCGKTTFSTKIVFDWCAAHSENIAIAKKDITRSANSSEETSKPTHFRDIDTLREYTFLFFVSLRDYSGSMCNVSQMVEDAIKRNKLPWDDSVWEHKCIVLTDAADEWYHPDIPFPPPCYAECKCHKDRSMPLYLQRTNITNIITSRPWKLANISMSDTLTRMFNISGVTNPKTLAENVINVLAEKDGISKNDRQCKCIDFFKKIEKHSLGNLITVPAVCVQLVHQFYVGRLMEDSLCAIYMNMLDMHIAKGLQNNQIEDFDTEEICVKEIKHIFETGKNEYVSANGSLVRSACALAFKTLTDSRKESSLVFVENTITKHMKKSQLDYLLQTGIITKKKSFALSSQKNIPYMFVHKTIQEFLASMHIAINQTEIEDNLNAIQSVYCDCESILDIGQLFIFTCGMCAPAAERMSKHIMDVISRDMERTLLFVSDPVFICLLSDLSYFAQKIVLGGFIEMVTNKQTCLQLTLSHVNLENFESQDIKENEPLNTLIDMNISNIKALHTRFRHKSQQAASNREQKISSQSRETLTYLLLQDRGQLDLQGLKLKYLSCCGYCDISNLDCTYMRSCYMFWLTPISEERILQSMSVTGKNITRLMLVEVKSIDLLWAALPNLTSLHTLILGSTELAVTQLYCLSDSLRKLVYKWVNVSAQDVKSMVEWSKSRDTCVRCELFMCYISSDETDICHLMKQQDGIDISQCEVKAKSELIHEDQIFISWSTILSK